MSSKLQDTSPDNSSKSYLLNVQSAAHLAGVTVDTIHRYRDFGLLPANQKDGEEFYNESDIRNLFYTKRQVQGHSSDESPADEADNLEDQKIENSQVSGRGNEEFDLLTAPGSPDTRDEDDSAADDSRDVELSSENNTDGSHQSSTPTAMTAQSHPDTVTANFFQKGLDLSSATSVSASPAASPPTEEEAASAKSSDASRQQLSAVGERETMIELNEALREQIEVLRQERDWLRQRVERLETRSEREQMLLLTESQTLKSVLADTRFGKEQSFWRKAIPWFKD